MASVHHASSSSPPDLQSEQEQLQRRIDAVRSRIVSLRQYAASKDVQLDELEEFGNLQRVLSEAPVLVTPGDGGANAEIVDHHGRRGVGFLDEGRPKAQVMMEIAKDYLQDEAESDFHTPGRGGASTSASGGSSASRDRSHDSSPSASQGSGGRYSEHFSSFQNLSLGDVLSTATTRTRHRFEDRQEGSPSAEDSRRSRREAESEDVPSLGEVLSTSRRPDLREKIRLAQERLGVRPLTESQEDRQERRATTQGDFGGSLGDILRTRDESAHRERRRFFNNSSASYDEPEGRPRGRSERHENAGGTEFSLQAREYQNDKTLANRALCRLHRSRYKEKTQSKEECSICLEVFKYGHVLACFGTGCKHTFHQACIVEWFRTGDVRCPLCRFDPISGTW